MALLIRVFSAHLAAALLVLAVIASGIHAALLPLVSQRLFSSPLPGLIAAALVILLPLYRLSPAWDAMYSADCLMTCVLLTSGARLRAWRFGALPALLFLLNPVAGLILTVFVACMLVNEKAGFILKSLCVLIAILAPWTVRNYLELGRFVPLRDDLGIALYSSNSPCARPTLEENMAAGCHQQTHPVNSASENRMVATMGEAAYNRFRLGTAFHWIAANPRKFAALTLARFLYFWFPPNRLVVCVVSVLGFSGLILLIRKQPRIGLLLLLSLAAGSALYYFVEAQDRYRTPVYWCVVLCAGYMLADGYRRVTSSLRKRWIPGLPDGGIPETPNRLRRRYPRRVSFRKARRGLRPGARWSRLSPAA
jgi:hypothetical protein